MAQALPFIIGGLQLVQSVQEGRAAQAEAENQARAREYNAKIAERNAALVGQQTEAEVGRQDRARRLRAGANIAAGGASGAGQNFDILSDNVTQETMDILNIQREGILSQQNFQMQAGMERTAASNIRSSAPSTASIVMGGAAKGLSSAYSMGGFSGGGSPM